MEGECYMTKTVGRKPKFSVEEVRKVILMFRENVQPMGRIGYTDIYRYANELFEKGIILNSTSIAFWRKENRMGRLCLYIFYRPNQLHWVLLLLFPWKHSFVSH